MSPRTLTRRLRREKRFKDFLPNIVRDTATIIADANCFDRRKVRPFAAWALGDIGDVRAIEPLLERLNDEDSHVQPPAFYDALIAILNRGVAS